jgi:hypothetical protein
MDFGKMSDFNFSVCFNYDSYLVSVLGSAAYNKPNFVSDLFLNSPGQSGIVGLTFYIRAKPWVVAIDDTLLIRNSDPVFLKSEISWPLLV